MMERKRNLGTRWELKVSVDAALETLKIICHQKDGWRKRVSVFRVEVIRINKFANTFVRLLYNLIPKGC